MTNNARTRRLTIIAQDPSIKIKKGDNEEILKAVIEIPAEDFGPGPSGYRVHVVDYDSSTGSHYIPLQYPPIKDGQYPDPFKKIKNDSDLLQNPHFHAQNVYAIIMKTLARFEFAMGRRVSWGFDGHQINVAPHAFADANAFYSEHERALMFGYFRSPYTRENVFSCLSHDVVVHETTHALLDGLRKRYTAPSSPEQAGFHEGFSDVVALLSVFALREVVSYLLDITIDQVGGEPSTEVQTIAPDLIDVNFLKKEALQKSVLFGLADEMGQEMSGIRGRSLRRSVLIKPLNDEFGSYLGQPEYEDPHRCGELFVAAMMNAFLEVWLVRIEKLRRNDQHKKFLDRELVVETGSEAAEHLLTMSIRALDYTPPTDITFGDYLSSFLTADYETVPDDTRYHYREHVLKSFEDYGIKPASLGVDGKWLPIMGECNGLKYDRTHFDSMLRDPDEVFRFLWENQRTLQIDDRAYTKIQSVRPCLRIGPDGFILRETVAEYVQIATMSAGELQQLYPPIGKPAQMPKDTEVTLYGGGTLIFDEYGRLKYHIFSRIFAQGMQGNRLDYLWKYGYFTDEDTKVNLFARMHLRRAAIFSNHSVEEEF